MRTTVRGDKGVFRSGPDWSYSISAPPGAPLTLRMNPIKSEFAVDASAPETFLVLPLSALSRSSLGRRLRFVITL